MRSSGGSEVSATITSIIALATALAASIPQIMKVLADRKRGIRESELQRSKQDTETWAEIIKAKDSLLKQYTDELTRLHKRVTELEVELDKE
jgi:hypothetical protein|nr:MAG TPA: hypothetical protein [Caudoviricetes sp.]